MTPATYSVIRYIADPARNEPLNMGILAWNEIDIELKIHSEAVARIIRSHPHLLKEALLDFELTLREEIKEAGLTPKDIPHWIERQSGFPMLISEPRYTTVTADSTAALATTIDRLLDRIVRPRYRTRRGYDANPVGFLTERLQQWIDRKIVQTEYPFPKSRTGVARSVNFFRNSGANVALDAIRMDLKKANQIILRADAEANKAADILAKNDDIRFYVYCQLTNDPAYVEANEEATKIIEASGATVESSIEDAIYILAFAD